jgi:hypothetical protein
LPDTRKGIRKGEYGHMAETKYGKYIIKAPLVENKYPPYTPCLYFESKEYFPELNFGVRYTYINQPIRMETTHTHEFDQFFGFLGTPEDLKVFGGEVELYLGEEGTKKTIDVTSVVYIPRGLVHGPIIWKRVDKPMMFFNCVITPQYSRKEIKAGSRATSKGASRGDEAKYEKYIIKEPYSWNVLPPYGARLLFDSHNYFPNTNFGIRYTYLTQARQMERPHAHDFDQLLTSFGPPEDIRLYDAESETYLGEEGEKHVTNTPHITYIPAGLIHGPSISRRMNKPVMMVNFIFTSQYTRSDQQAGFLNYLELTARKVTLEEASRTLGTAVPRPAYLPENYKIQEIYAQDESIRLLISDKEIEKNLITLGDATGARQRYHFTCKMEMEIKWHPEGQPGGLKVPGEQVTVGKGKGVLIYRESNIEVRWLLPPQSTPKQPGQYEIALKASQNIKDELLKVAQSVKA